MEAKVIGLEGKGEKDQEAEPRARLILAMRYPCR